MAAIPMVFKGISEVSLRVRDLQESSAFYRELFGLEPVDTEPPTAKSRKCRAGHPLNQDGFSVVLTEGLPPGAAPNVDHFSLEVPTLRDLMSVYSAATERGVQATEPRMYAGRWQTFLFDPDGYKVEVMTRDSGTAEAGSYGE